MHGVGEMKTSWGKMEEMGEMENKDIDRHEHILLIAVVRVENWFKPHSKAPANKAIPPMSHGLSKSPLFSLNSFVHKFRQ